MRSSASPRPTLHLAIFLAVALASASAFPHSNLPLGSPSRQGGNISPRMSAIKAPPKAIIFDIDGTLADSYNLAFTATNTVLRNNGHQETTPDEYHQGTRYTTPVRLARHCGLEEPSTPDPTSEFSTLGERLGKEFDELYIGLTDVKTAPLYDGMRQLVVDVADVGNVKLAALSNAAVAYVQRVIQVHELAPLFAILHGADDVPAPKPSGDGLILTCMELGVSPSEAVYVGDSPSDGAAAREAGMPCIGVSWGSHKKETLYPAFDQVVCSVNELRKALLMPDAAH